MNLVFIIKNRDNTPFMVVSTTPEGSTFKPMTEDAKELVGILREEYAKTPITKPELVQSMDASKIIEGPSPSGTAVQKKVASLTEIQSEPIELKNLPVLSISEVLLSEFSDAEFKNVLTFKASSFISDQTRSSAHFEIKGVRAVWDPSLSIPGTNRRGGFRCPVGTRYGGQITDRFGRSCGWGVARRIANQIADIGERLEQRDDDKRKRRLDRRNARMMRRLGGVAETGRVEGGLRGIADRLEGGDAPKPRVGRGRVPVTGRIEGGLRGIADRLEGGAQPRPRRDSPEIEAPSERVPRNRRRDVLPETAPTPTPKPRPARRPAPAGQRRPQPRPQARPRVAPQPANVDVLTARDASDASETEDFKPYVLRKYGEYAKRVREIREGGGNAGMLTRREWYEINKNNLRDAWKDAHGRSAPLDFEPPAPRNRRPQNNRRRRRQATAQGAGRSASRKPTANDVPEPAPAKPVRRRGAKRRPAGVSDELWNEYKDYVAMEERRNNSAISFARWAQAQRDLGRNINFQARPARRSPDGRGFVTPGDGGAPARANVKMPDFGGEGWDAINQPDGSTRWKKGNWEIELLPQENGEFRGLIARNSVDGDALEQEYRGLQDQASLNRYLRDFSQRFLDQSGGDSEPPEPPTPRTPPRAPTSQRGRNAQQLKMNNLVDNHYTELPKLQPDDGKFVAVRVGNKGINTLADARRYRGSLADIPDEFLLDVIQKRTHKDRGAMSPNVVDAVRSVFPSADDAEVVQIMKRLSTNFRRSLNEAPPAIDEDTKKLIKALKDKNIEFIEVPASSGITSPLYYFHLSDDPAKWGRGYFLKKPDRGWESNQGNGKKISQHAELIGNILAKQIGFANGAPRLVKGSNNNPFLLMDIFVNNAEGKVAGRYSPGGVTDAKSRFFNGALNAIMNVADRHNGNGDQIKGNGAIPLDFGRALFGRKSASGQMQYLSRLMMDQASWGGYSKRLNGKVGAARTREVNAIRAELQADIALAAENMRVGLRRVNEMNQAYDVLDIDAKDDRMADLVYNIDQFASPEYLDLLMQKINP